MPVQKQTAVGIDGCRGGWVAAILRPDSSFEWQLNASLRAILGSLPETSTILIDMIIGLPNKQQPFRSCDRLARKILRPHGARVFSAPPREALGAETYSEACRLARETTGKAISKQCWNLFPKIRELESLNDPRLRESHPEVVFARFNGGLAVRASKKAAEGRARRLQLLGTQNPKSTAAYTQARSELGKGTYQPDDCIDALALCLAAADSGSLTALTDLKRPDAPKIWY